MSKFAYIKKRKEYTLDFIKQGFAKQGNFTKHYKYVSINLFELTNNILPPFQNECRFKLLHILRNTI